MLEVGTEAYKGIYLVREVERDFSEEMMVKVTPEDEESIGKTGRVGDIQAQEVVCAEALIWREPSTSCAEPSTGRSAEKWGAWPEKALDRQAEARLWS